jgi:hypothetical protein
MELNVENLASGTKYSLLEMWRGVGGGLTMRAECQAIVTMRARTEQDWHAAAGVKSTQSERPRSFISVQKEQVLLGNGQAHLHLGLAQTWALLGFSHIFRMCIKISMCS